MINNGNAHIKCQKLYAISRSLLRQLLPPRIYYWLRDLIVPGEVYCCFKVLEHLENSSVMIDVGAHVGGSLIKFAQSGWQIFAFEPDNENRKKLEYLCSRENLINVKIDSRAVSNENKQNLIFFRSDLSSGISGLSVFDSTHKSAQEVESVTLNKFCNDNEIKKVNFLKIDTEGWDLFVLKGFPFERIKPNIIMAEFEDKKTVPLGYTFDEMAQYLVDQGYSVAVSEWYPVIQYGGMHKFRQISEYPVNLCDSMATGNLIAVENKGNLDKIINLVRQYVK